MSLNRDETDTNKYGLPHKLFDYMSAGLCVVASRKALYVSEIVEKSDAGIVVDPSDPDSTARALDELCTNRMRTRQMGNNGLKAVSEVYNWNSQARVLVEHYDRLAGR